MSEFPRRRSLSSSTLSRSSNVQSRVASAHARNLGVRVSDPGPKSARQGNVRCRGSTVVLPAENDIGDAVEGNRCRRDRNGWGQVFEFRHERVGTGLRISWGTDGDRSSNVRSSHLGERMRTGLRISVVASWGTDGDRSSNFGRRILTLKTCAPTHVSTRRRRDTPNFGAFLPFRGDRDPRPGAKGIFSRAPR